MEDSPLKGMMDPETIAVFGASESSTSVGAQVFSNLVTDGFGGTIYPINPKHKKVGGLTCYPSATAVGREIDLAVIATPARTGPAHSWIGEVCRPSTSHWPSTRAMVTVTWSL